MKRKDLLNLNLDRKITVEKLLKTDGNIYEATMVRREVNRELLNFFTENTTFYLCDTRYKSLTEANVEELCNEFNRFQYEKEEFDCDKFAKIFIAHAILSYQDSNVNAGIGVGMLTFKHKNGGHAINIVLVDEKGKLQIRIVEPQLRKMYSFSEYIMLYAYEDVTIKLILL